LPIVDTPITNSAAGVRLTLRVSPGASRNAIGAVEADAAGTAYLKVSVTAAAEGGKANAAVIKLLSKAWRLPKGAFSIAAGRKDRRKVLIIDASPDAIAACLCVADSKPKD